MSCGALLLAATHSGAGKTTLTLGLLAALARRGLRVQPFKCGPDFIDPSLHQIVAGRLSRNLDLRMCGPDYVRALFARQLETADIGLVEGVMGLFDGGLASPASLAKALGIPVALVVDAAGQGESVAAVVKGFETLDAELTLMGVIFNRVASPRHLELLTAAVQANCKTPVLGHLPKNREFAIGGRHLGLRMGWESPLSAAQLELLAGTVARGIDLDLLLDRAALAGRPGHREAAGGQRPEVAAVLAGQGQGRKRPRIGVARDRAFCFYYPDNLELLQAQGAELVEFSPLADRALPPGLDGLYLGGGYPELYAAELAANLPMREAIRAWSDSGRPLYAECGGFIYLCQGVVDREARFWPLAGVFPTRAVMRERLVGLGYREAEIIRPCLLGERGRLFGHEFHYSEIESMPETVGRAFRLAEGREEGYQIHNTLAGYLHLHFGRTPEAAGHLLAVASGCRRA